MRTRATAPSAAVRPVLRPLMDAPEAGLRPVSADVPAVVCADVCLTMSPPIPPVSPDIRQLPKEPGFSAYK
ncbi:hypothetical protein Stube_13820 [Streptomyces tubercidicus]|uniref:Uncharacterized protein n=1 Tax=Streptomyces tubercidicus TaxID=47759 RepID=A0A640ULZ2_9ACTN|nr:hypothetical protein Stube_13820 [Streptomyces tubercidicus]